MDELKTAISLVPLLRTLYKLDVISISPGFGDSKPYIQITADKFRKLFPDMRAGADNYYRFNYDGILIIAVEVR